MGTALTLGLFFGIFLLAGLLASAFIPLGWMLLLAGGLSTLLLYVLPMGGLKLPLAVVAALGMWRSLRLNHFQHVPWLRAYVALLVIQAISISWAPNPILGVRLILYSLPLGFIASLILNDHPDVERWVRMAFVIGLASTAIEALLVIAFRIFPSVESRFLASAASSIFIPGNAATEIYSGSYTILDPAKSGGLFLNANVAAVFLGATGAIALGTAKLLGANWLRYIGLLNLLAVPFAGSKGAILIEVVLGLILQAVFIWRQGGVSLKGLALSSFALACAVPTAYVATLLAKKSVLLANSVDTLESRFPMWGFAWQTFIEKPWTGLGFGGWELKWPMYALAHGLNPNFPPHNSLLNYFIQSGIFASLVAAWFVVTAIWQCRRALLSGNDETRQAAVGIGMGLIWLFGQALAENYGFIGEPHMTLLIGMVLALLARQMYREEQTKKS